MIMTGLYSQLKEDVHFHSSIIVFLQVVLLKALLQIPPKPNHAFKFLRPQAPLSSSEWGGRRVLSVRSCSVAVRLRRVW